MRAVSASFSARTRWRSASLRGHRARGDDRQPPLASLLLALAQRVETEAEHTRQELDLRVGLAILSRARVRRNRLRGRVAEIALLVELEAQRRREALLPLTPRHARGIGLAADDQREDTVRATEPLEGEDFLVDPVRSRRSWRADHQQAGRALERLAQLGAEVGGAGEFVTVSEHRRGARRDRSHRGLLADQVLGYTIGLNRTVQPACPLLVTVAVADEGLVAVCVLRVQARLRSEPGLQVLRMDGDATRTAATLASKQDPRQSAGVQEAGAGATPPLPATRAPRG